MNQSKGKKIKEFLNKLSSLEAYKGDSSLHDTKAVESFMNKLLAENFNMSYYRLMSREEKNVLSNEAFEFLINLVKTEKISYEHVEQFINQLLNYRNDMREPMDVYTLSTLLEMMTYTNFQDNIIDQIIELYINSPELIGNLRHSIH